MTFDDVLVIINGRNQRAVENPNGKYPIYGSGGIMGYADSYICEADTVVIGRKGSINNPIFVEEPFWNVDTAFGLAAKRELLLPRYLYYFCRNFDFERLNKAVTIPSLTKSDLLKIEITLPTLEIQEDVVNKLRKVERIIQARKQQLQKLDELVKARFVELFGDPVTNPKGWTTKPLLDMGYCKNGMNFHAGDSGMEVNCLGVGDFQNLSVIDGTAHLPVISLNEAPPEESMLRDGDIVFVRSNGNKALVGRCLIVYPRNTPTTYSGFCIRYRLTSNEVDTTYLLRVLKTDSIRKKMAGRGANIQNLNQQILAALDIPLPPIEQQQQFAAFVKQTGKSKAAIQKALDEAQLLFDGLMQKYFG